MTKAFPPLGFGPTRWVFLALALCAFPSGYAQLILAGWDFPNNPDDAIVDVAVPANAGATISSVGTSVLSFNLVGTSTYSASATGWNAGANVKWWEIEVSTVGYSNLAISSRQTSSGTGPRNFALQYRIGVAGMWTALATVPPITSGNNWNQGVLNNIGLPAACENQPQLFFRWIMTGNVSVSSGTIAMSATSRIDDIYVVANSTDHFRTIASGDWLDGSIWQSSPTGGAPWTTTGYAPSAFSQTITIRNGHAVTINAYVSMDEVTVDPGGTLTYFSGAFDLHNGPGTDLRVNGTFEDLATTSVFWEAGATWSLGSGATYVKGANSSSANWRDYYEGGIANISENAYWILRRSGTPIPSLVTVGMVYPNLIIENFHTVATTFLMDGATGGFPTILGSFDVGGVGTSPVTVNYNNTNITPMQLLGNMAVRAGSIFNLNGRGVEIDGSIQCDGEIRFGAASDRQWTFREGNPQSITGNGTFSANRMRVNKPANDLALGMSITVNLNLDLISGRILNDGTPHVVTLNTAATATSSSNASFATGKVRKLGNAAFTYPVGKGSLLRPIGMSAVPAPGVVPGWTETFTRSAGDCAAACPADGYTTDWGTWTVTATGPNGVNANNWYISYAESSPFNGANCLPAVGTNPTLHIGPPAGGICATEDCGAFYDDGPDNITDLRVESPYMDFSGMNVNSISFITVHQGGTSDPNDRVTMWVYNGNEWVFATTLLTGCQTSYSATGPIGYVIPLSDAMSNIPNGRIGFRWQNNGNGVRNTRSFAIDNLSLGRRTNIESHIAEYFPVDGTQVYNPIVNAPLDHVSTCEYWTLDREAGFYPRNVTLSWDLNSCGVTELADLRVAHFDTLAAQPSWFDRGNIATTGDVNAGTVTSGPNSLFGPFTLASISNENPLPITLLGFTGQAIGNTGILQWTTATEQDNAYFELLSAGADTGLREEFKVLGRVPGAGTSWTPLDYRFLDERPDKRGTYYYQLRQVDFDGTSSLSHMIALDYGNGGFREPSVWPNPFSTDATVVWDAPNSGTLLVTLRNALGQEQGSTSIAVDQGRFSFQLGDLAPVAQGIYFLELALGEHRTVTRVVRQ